MTRFRARLPALALLCVLVAGCVGAQTQTILSTVGEEITPAAGPASAAPSPGTGNCPTSPPAPLGAGQVRDVTVETEQGTFVITVEADLGPLAAGNFVELAACGFYDGTVFHRIVPGFVIQGGDPTGTGGGGPGYEFANDPVSVPYDRGVVAMANGGRDTNGSQFFVMLADNERLPPDYSVFGRVTSGMEVVDAIAAAADAEKPSDPVAMTHVFVGKR
jgi:cyclophilin family peptidyl-prolyl cis-trans isomerase